MKISVVDRKNFRRPSEIDAGDNWNFMDSENYAECSEDSYEEDASWENNAQMVPVQRRG